MSLIYKIYKSPTDVYGFYAAYISNLTFDPELDLFDTPAENIESCLMDLAATKIEVDPRFITKLGQYRHHIRKDFEEWLGIVKDKAFRAGIPLRAELLNMVYSSHEGLGVEAEQESLGFNHPAFIS